jgi:D-arabinose 1-dehydrogenase-like Zn-dependent alcohol dehydrogenase
MFYHILGTLPLALWVNVILMACGFLSMLDTYGRFVIIGLLDELLPNFNAMSLLGNDTFLGGSHTYYKKECLQILSLTVDHGVKPWITLLPMCDAKKAEAVKKAG